MAWIREEMVRNPLSTNRIGECHWIKLLNASKLDESVLDESVIG